MGMERFFNLLSKYNLTVSTAESCTGGMIASNITDLSGASSYFGMGVVTYSNEAKSKLIGVSSETLEKYGAVSEQTAREMAQGVRKLSGSDISISVTGIAGPTGGTKEKPVGLVYIAVSGKFGTVVTENMFGNGRTEVRKSTVKKAISLACDYIEKNYC